MGTMEAMSLHAVRRRGPRTALRTAVPALLATAVVGLSAPAWAHTVLVNAGPNAGDKVASGTDLVALQFGEELDASGTLEVAVLDSDESAVAVSDPQVLSTDGSIVCTRVSDLEPGVHTVRYEVTSADGHEVRGNYQFTVAEGADAPDALGCDVDALPEPTEEKSLSDQDQGDFPAWALWTIGGVVVVTAGLAAVAVARSRRDDSGDEGTTEA